MYDTHVMAGTKDNGTKDARQAAILQLAQSETVHTQADMLKGLRAKRFRVDQSTLSRDLRELNVRKVAGKYVVTESKPAPPDTLDLSAAVSEFTTCGPHLIVVRTGIGQAQPVSIRIDGEQEPAITATLAGDDTIFVATKNRRSQTVALRRLKQWFGDKHEI